MDDERSLTFLVNYAELCKRVGNLEKWFSRAVLAVLFSFYLWLFRDTLAAFFIAIGANV